MRQALADNRITRIFKDVIAVVDGVTKYLQEVLLPTLRQFRVPERYVEKIADTAALQMVSLLRHWDDLAFRKTILLLGMEEGDFYEPAGKTDVKRFVVVTLRNSPLETIQSDHYASAGMTRSLSDQDVKAITGGAIRFFNSLDFSAMCRQAKVCAADDFYQEIAERHPAAWTALRVLGTTSAKTVDFPKVRFDDPFSAGAYCAAIDDHRSEDEPLSLSRKVVYDGYSPEWDPQLQALLTHLTAAPGGTLVVDSMKSVTRNFEKLMDVLEFLLTRNGVFASANFYIENGHVERRMKPLRAGHTSREMDANIRRTAGLGYRHAAALKMALN